MMTRSGRVVGAASRLVSTPPASLAPTSASRRLRSGRLRIFKRGNTPTSPATARTSISSRSAARSSRRLTAAEEQVSKTIAQHTTIIPSSPVANLTLTSSPALTAPSSPAGTPTPTPFVSSPRAPSPATAVASSPATSSSPVAVPAVTTPTFPSQVAQPQTEDQHSSSPLTKTAPELSQLPSTPTPSRLHVPAIIRSSPPKPSIPEVSTSGKKRKLSLVLNSETEHQDDGHQVKKVLGENSFGLNYDENYFSGASSDDDIDAENSPSPLPEPSRVLGQNSFGLVFGENYPLSDSSSVNSDDTDTQNPPTTAPQPVRVLGQNSFGLIYSDNESVSDLETEASQPAKAVNGQTNVLGSNIFGLFYGENYSLTDPDSGSGSDSDVEMVDAPSDPPVDLSRAFVSRTRRPYILTEDEVEEVLWTLRQRSMTRRLKALSCSANKKQKSSLATPVKKTLRVLRYKALRPVYARVTKTQVLRKKYLGVDPVLRQVGESWKHRAATVDVQDGRIVKEREVQIVQPWQLALLGLWKPVPTIPEAEETRIEEPEHLLEQLPEPEPLPEAEAELEAEAEEVVEPDPEFWELFVPDRRLPQAIMADGVEWFYAAVRRVLFG